MSNAYKVRTFTCETCGKTVTERMPQGRRFCSRACSQYAPQPERKKGATVGCAVCDAPVYVPEYRLRRSKVFFCSPEHANEWQGRNKVTQTCKTCGESYSISLSRLTWDNPTYCSLACRDNDPDAHARLLEMNAIQQRGKQTKPERIGYALLNELGIDYLPQHTIAGKFVVDAFVPAHDTVIQIDGDYWHGNPIKFPDPDARQRRRMALDLSQDAYLAKCGYRVVRIWASSLLHDLRGEKERLLLLLS